MSDVLGNPENPLRKKAQEMAADVDAKIKEATESVLSQSPGETHTPNPATTPPLPRHYPAPTPPLPRPYPACAYPLHNSLHTSPP